MTKRIKSLVFWCLILSKLSAQQCDTAGYSRAYWFNGIQTSLAIKILPNVSGSMFLFGNLQTGYNTPFSTSDVYITKLNSRGTPLQTKILSYNADVNADDVEINAAGNYFLSGYTVAPNETGTDPWIAMLDNSGNPVWSFGLGRTTGEFFKVAATSDGGCVVAGRVAPKTIVNSEGSILRAYNHAIVFKLDASGNVDWGKEYYSDDEVEQIFQVAQLSDGSIIVTGTKENSPNLGPGSDNFVMKLSGKDGSTIWQKQTSIYLGQISELANGNILFRPGNYLYTVSAADGTILSASTFSPPPAYASYYDLNYAGSISANEDLYYDFINQQNILLFKISNLDSIEWVSSLPGNTGYGATDYPFSTLVNQNVGGSIYISGGMVSTGLATGDSAISEENSFLLRTSLNGKSQCTSPSPISFTFTNLATPQAADFTWYQSDNLAFNNERGLSVSAQFSQNGLACSEDFCCEDTTINITVSMCLGGTYTLPDGTIVSKTGYYTSILARASGCDSIINVNVQIALPIKPNLGNDTCFVQPQPIVFTAVDSFAQSFVWQDGSTKTTFKATTPGTYWVQATSACGVIGDTVIVYAKCSLPLFIPSAFTPNGDGLNDIFRIPDMKGQHLVELSVYNRWGQMVFQTSNPSQGWDGTINGQKPATETFVYFVRYIDMLGKNQFVKGTVSLIR